MRVAIIGELGCPLPFYKVSLFDEDEAVSDEYVAEYDLVFIGKCRSIKRAQTLSKVLVKNDNNVFIQNKINTTIIDELGAGIC